RRHARHRVNRPPREPPFTLSDSPSPILTLHGISMIWRVARTLLTGAADPMGGSAMKRISAVALTVALAAGACLPKDAPDGADDARAALPVAANLVVAVPGLAGAHKIGDTATTYTLTRTAATTVNGGVAIILGLVKSITDFPATSAKDGTFV